MRLLLFLFVAISSTCVLASPCNDTCTDANIGCDYKLWSLETLLNAIRSSFFPVSQSTVEVLRQSCENTTICFKCDKWKRKYQKECDEAVLQVHEFEKNCIVPTLREIFEGGVECAKNNDFFSSDFLLKLKQSCFLKTMRNHCTGSNYSLFEKYYFNIMKVYTSVSGDKKFQELKCMAVEAGQQTKLELLNLKGTNHEELSRVLKNIHTCYKPVELSVEPSGLEDEFA
ncbi:hypothetical protein CAEBREN_23727 [Caenorhabditis brenneri]|uniref:DUF19 domain-containing protein n=1 Tax=Caenorhabditis brenneri TaxID=135651 RepID=G0NN00_CAEBE|nr:hypothetical protein CAEBREN_23727 [Caenorhabditis brenneri]